MSTDNALPIHISGLTKQYGDLYALDRVDLDIKSGEFLTLLGPSGSGKTTLLMAIAGFNRPDAGSIKFASEEMILTPPHRREVGMVFQSYALFPHMTVAENIAFPLKLRRVAAAERNRRVEEALQTVQLEGLGSRNIDQLSGGQRQRVALARAFVFRPRILLMDEPLSALDKKLRERMQIELKQLHRQLGVTTVYVTHDQREALTMSDRIAVINHGRLAQVDTPTTIYNQPVNAFVADFIGESTVLPLERSNGNELYVGDQLVTTTPDNSTEGSWSLVIRPERLLLLDHSSSETTPAVTFNGTIKEAVFQGDSAFVLINLENSAEIAVRFSTGAVSKMARLSAGEKISVGLHRDDIIVIAQDAA
ncbi:ABC transporter ATP-binding protein [Chromatiales bacterium (ex Bugula neritina AB1)]|nr:ABC transporter ATP-binding protein [Chromatiales bacterium (ex Bugula neritina AB1)]